MTIFCKVIILQTAWYRRWFYKSTYNMFHICTTVHQMILLNTTNLQWKFDIYHVWKSDSALIQASISYCVNIIGALIYLLKEIHNIITNYLVFFLFLIPHFLISLMRFRVFFVLCFLIFTLCFPIFLMPIFW